MAETIQPSENPFDLVDDERKANFFAQMEQCLLKQKLKCDHYVEVFREQNNDNLSKKFTNLSISTARDLEVLRQSKSKNDVLPAYKYEYVNVNCVPINVDVKEKELQIIVKTSNLRSEDNALIYAIGEFEFPVPREETFADVFSRWLHSVKIEPRNFFCCRAKDSRQLDVIYATENVSFTTPKSTMLEFDKPLAFYVDKGKSRQFKRKFKPVKLAFYEKTSFIKRDKKLGTIQINIDGINEVEQHNKRYTIMNGRKELEACADIKLRVREPLANKAVRAYEEKFLLLTF